MKPRCPYCGRKVAKENADLHEALITKGMVAGFPKEDRDWINVRYNCVIRHHDSIGCVHTGGVGGDDAFEKAARYLVKWEGSYLVHQWLKGVANMHPELADVLRRFETIDWSDNG